MLLALLLLAVPADWVPMRWPSGDPSSLELVAGTPVNCLLLEEPSWSAAFAEKAGGMGLATLGVVHAGPHALETARRALAAKLTGVVLEGEFEDSVRRALADTKAVVVELPSRTSMRFDPGLPVVGTWQGVWPGINPTDDGSAKAAPTGAPWIDTNSGFLRFARSLTAGPLWVANRPPQKSLYPATRYLQAIGDAALCGARWVIALDADFEQRLIKREEKAMAGWKRITGLVRFLEERKEWREYRPGGRLAVVQDPLSGALLSGSILDMMGSRHTPARPVAVARLEPGALEGAQLAVNVDPSLLSDAQKEVLRAFARGGGTTLTGPPGWKFPAPRPGQITLDKTELEKLDAIWRDVNWLVGRRNLGARLFNVSSMLSAFLVSPDGKKVVLELVNYSDYPVEAITVHLLGKWRRAMLHTPESTSRELAIYPIDEGTGVEVERVYTFGALVLE